MILIEIAPNANCAPVDLRLFHDLEPGVLVGRVRLERRGAIRWFDVTGWTEAGRPCPAVAQKVDDSGEGVALLVFGGDAGLRLRPAWSSRPWRLDDGEQWGEPFVILADRDDLQVAGQPAGACSTAPSS